VHDVQELVEVLVGDVRGDQGLPSGAARDLAVVDGDVVAQRYSRRGVERVAPS